MILHDVEVDGVRTDMVVTDGRITDIGPDLADQPGDDVVDGQGGALLPGLHDHHLHVRALAARADSVDLAPPAVTDRASFDRVLAAAAAAAPEGSWLRGVGYDDHAVGPLDRHDLDAVAPGHRVRVQHRSGLAWILNTAALDAVGREGDGQLFGADAELRERWGGSRPDLAGVGAMLASRGVTGVTDATVTNGPDDAAALAAALPQRVTALGGTELAGAGRKLVVAEHLEPDPAPLADAIADAHAAGRPVAVHAASRAALVVTLAALDAAGVRTGDRVEHASVAPPELVEWLARLGVTVVIQPNFVAEHGDRYLAEVEADDQAWLHRARGFVEAGVPLAAGTDAPFGRPDPWAAMRAAVERRAPSGAVLGPHERLTHEAALRLFLGRPDSPGGPARRVEVGAAADLCLLRVPWAEAREALDAELVALTMVGGQVVHRADGRG